MEFEPKLKSDIKAVYHNCTTVEDIVDLSNLFLGNVKIFSGDTKPLKLSSVTCYLDPKKRNQAYKSFDIPKKSGGKRTIHQPERALKMFLKCFSIILDCSFDPSESSHGFIKGKSIASNAAQHVKRNYVLNIDLKDFFHSIDRNRVKYFLMENNPSLKKNEKVAFQLASLCCAEIMVGLTKKDVLPQGSPCSPVLTNLICIYFDKKMTGLSKRFGAKYTRYADDITFSSQKNIFKEAEFRKELERIIKLNKFELNDKKTRIQSRDYRQEVTGLIVNQKVNVSKIYKKEVRRLLYLWEHYGYEKADNIHKLRYGYSSNLVNVLRGKIEFFKMVKTKEDSTYIALDNRLNQLLKKNRNKTDIEKRIDLILEHGLNALDQF